MIDDMINDANFRIADDIAITIPDKLTPTTVAMGLLPSRAVDPELFPLSGCPRYLITENASTG